mmetsp:Transcript_22100/g.25149  ORF Transcript_22100/g.25149 Transcript_22100/m.25149 type:complete len:243 (+) Transcript_22100:414-1142(+)
MNQMAQEKMKGGGAGGADMMAQLANMDPEEMMKMMEESLNDPATMQYLEQFGQGMGDVMEQLAQMDPEVMKQQMQANLAQMTSPEILNSILEESDEVLDSLLQQGLITPEQMKEYKNDPAAFQSQMASAFDEMSKILADPNALDAALEMMSGMSGILNDPTNAMQSLADAINSELGDDDKIEEARLQLLADPNAAGNPAMAALFENEDMITVLNDPVKFREQVKKGQEMLTEGTGNAKYGEL